MKEEQPHKVTVRVLDLAMKDMLEMTPKDKWQYADMLYGMEHIFVDIIDEALSHYEEQMKCHADQ